MIGYFESYEEFFTAAKAEGYAETDEYPRDQYGLQAFCADNSVVHFDKQGVEESFRDALDAEGPIIIVGLEYYPSDALKAVDPIAYRCGLLDYVDSISRDDVVIWL